MNPQFHVQIPRSSNNKCHVVVSVTQYYETNPLDSKKKKPLFAIGFAVYEVPHSMPRLTPNFVSEHVSPQSALSFPILQLYHYKLQELIIAMIYLYAETFRRH